MPGRWMMAAWMFAIAASGCGGTPAALTQQAEARRLASDLRVQFSRAADAANRAVIVESDEASAAAAREAREATAAVARDVEQLHPLLQSLSYTSELDQLNTFKARFAEYRALDNEILPLAVSNPNLESSSVRSLALSLGSKRTVTTACDEQLRALEEAIGKHDFTATR